MDVYFGMPGEISEHEGFLRAKMDLEERRMRQINEVMSPGNQHPCRIPQMQGHSLLTLPLKGNQASFRQWITDLQIPSDSIDTLVYGTIHFKFLWSWLGVIYALVRILERLRQEDQKFKANLKYILTLRPAWAT